MNSILLADWSHFVWFLVFTYLHVQPKNRSKRCTLPCSNMSNIAVWLFILYGTIFIDGVLYFNDEDKISLANHLCRIGQVWYIEDITCPRVDMNFIFEWSTRYLTSERSERVRYRVDHEKIKFISISGHVIFCLLYKHQWNTKPFYFNIFNGLKVERVVTKHGRSTWTKTKFIW